jgi:redoxin
MEVAKANGCISHLKSRHFEAACTKVFYVFFASLLKLFHLNKNNNCSQKEVSGMAKLPGIDEKLIKLNPDWTVENAASTPLEKEMSVNDFNGKRLVVTLPGAGGFCNKELDLIKENMAKFKDAGADEVIVIVGTDILSNAGRGLPNLLQDPDQAFAKANKLNLEGVRSRYLQRSVIAVDASGEQLGREDAELLGCRTVDGLVEVAKKAFS